MSWSHGVFALLHVSPHCAEQIRTFLHAECSLPGRKLVDDLHLTVYHARRPFKGLKPCITESRVRADVPETRLMVMAPGGENPRPELDASRRSIGLRLTRRNAAISQVQALRAEFFRYETPRVLNGRRPSTASSNAFGARHYQPHITLLRPRPRVEIDLRQIGELFRERFQWIEFDRFEVKLVSRREREPGR